MEHTRLPGDLNETLTAIDGRYTRSTMLRVIWASRLCVANRVEGQPGSDWLAATFDGKAERKVLLALIRVWDGILVSTNRKLILHQPDCTCLSEHERALVSALSRPQQADTKACDAALQSVLPLSAARLLRAAIEQLASALDLLERQTGGLWLASDADATGWVAVGSSAKKARLRHAG